MTLFFIAKELRHLKAVVRTLDRCNEYDFASLSFHSSISQRRGLQQTLQIDADNVFRPDTWRYHKESEAVKCLAHPSHTGIHCVPIVS